MKWEPMNISATVDGHFMGVAIEHTSATIFDGMKRRAYTTIGETPDVVEEGGIYYNSTEKALYVGVED